MSCGIVEICMDDVQKIAVVPLIYRLRGFYFALVKTHVYG